MPLCEVEAWKLRLEGRAKSTQVFVHLVAMGDEKISQTSTKENNTPGWFLIGELHHNMM